MARVDILMITTSTTAMGDWGEPTGVWFEELAAPYYAFVDAGAAVTLASIAGGSVPIDPRSLKPKGQNPASVDRFLVDDSATGALAATRAVDTAPCSTCRAAQRLRRASAKRGWPAGSWPPSATGRPGW